MNSMSFCELEIPTTIASCEIENVTANQAALMGVVTHTIG